MKEKKNHTRLDDENVGKAKEPVGAAIRTDIAALGYDIDSWPGMPLVGPSSIDEVNARIDQAEQEINNETGFSWEQVMMDAQAIVNRHETTVY